MKHLLSELRRRRVPQVVGIYLVAGFGILQGAEIALPRMGLPDWTVTFLLVLVLVGLPVVIALAWAYDLTGEGVQRTPPLADALTGKRPQTGGAGGSGTAGRIAAVGAIVVLGLAGVAFVAFSGSERVPLEEGTVAVMPFRVSGGLVGAEGMADLLSTRLSGDYGPRAVDPRITLRAWREAGGREDLLPEELKEAALSTGASHMLTGELVQAGSTVTLSAALEPTTGAFSRRLRATTSGPADSILGLVDRLTASLLSQEAGEAADRLADLTSTSLEAVASYLAGRESYREGRFRDAAEAFDRALAIDSTFALAALSLRDAWGWIDPNGVERDRAARLAWEHRARLSRRDRAILIARLGPGYPEMSSPEEMVHALRSALELAPDDPAVWETYGDQILHWGHLDLSPNPAVEARRALEKAWGLDPHFTAPVIHLIELAARDRDTAALRRYRDAYAPVATRTQHVSQLYLAALGLRDSALAATYEIQLDEASTFARYPSRWAALPQDGMRRWLTRSAERADSRARSAELLSLAELEATVGRPGAAVEAMETARLEGAGNRTLGMRAYRDAMLLDGDMAYAAGRLRDWADAGSDEADRAWPRCLLERQRLATGDTAGIGRSAAEFAAFRADDDSPAAHAIRACGHELAVTREALAGGLDALAGLDSLEALLRPDPVPVETLVVTTLLAARIRHMLGDHRGALASARRFQLVSNVAPAAWLIQARAAARLGYRDEAVNAYRRYVEYRADAEPGTSAHAELAAAQAELAALLGEGRE